MSTKFWVIVSGVMLVLACVGLSMFFVEKAAHLKTSAECEKREALIKAADDHAAAIEATLAVERQARAEIDAENKELEKRLNNVRKPKKANDFSNLPDAARADSLRNSIIRAVNQ